MALHVAGREGQHLQAGSGGVPWWNTPVAATGAIVGTASTLGFWCTDAVGLTCRKVEPELEHDVSSGAVLVKPIPVEAREGIPYAFGKVARVSSRVFGLGCIAGAFYLGVRALNNQ
jgi:hypothetical protein